MTAATTDQLTPPPREDGSRRNHKAAAPTWLWVAGVVVVLPALIPVLALVARVIGASDAAWDTLGSARTAQLLGRSIFFALVVTAAASSLGVAAAWITTRTDIRYSRIWSTLLALPLVIPSYVLALSFISFAGPRGLFADTTGVSLPSISGFWGAVVVLVLATYPYVYLVVRSTIVRIDPALEEAARGLGSSATEAFRRITLPQVRPGGRCRLAARCALHPLRLRGRLTHGVRRVHPRDLRPVPGTARPHACSRAGPRPDAAGARHRVGRAAAPGSGSAYFASRTPAAAPRWS